MTNPELQYNNSQQGFYHEGKLGASLPCWTEVTYISGEYMVGHQPESGMQIKCLKARKFSHYFLVDPDETRGFNEIEDATLERLISSSETPQEFVRWVQRIQKQGLKEDEPDKPPEFIEWMKKRNLL